MKYRFKLEGISPLIQHYDNIEGCGLVKAAQKGAYKKAPKGDDRGVPWTWKTYLYRQDDTGDVVIPQENIMSMLMAAGMKIPMKGKETFKSYSQLICMDQLDFPLLVSGNRITGAMIDSVRDDAEFEEHADAVRGLGFRLLVKRAAVGASKHVRVRPMFHGWSVAGTFEIDPEDEPVLTESVLKDLFDTAGRRIGLGDWRPGAKRPGAYGRFTTTLEKIL